MLKYEVMLWNQMWRMQEAMKKGVQDFIAEEDGVEVVQVIVILVIVLAVAAIFRKNIATLVNAIWTSIFNEAGTAVGGTGVGTATSFQ